MPAIYTHINFSTNVYNGLPNSIKEKISPSFNIYKIFSQSFDNLFFSKEKTITELGKLAHRKNINEYFINIIEYIKENNLEENSEALSFLYGSLSHYILDKNLHPYIFYQTGVYNNKDKETYKYNGLHTKYEYMLDGYFYEKNTSNKYKNINPNKDLFKYQTFSKELSTLINKIYQKTYSKKSIYPHLLNSIKRHLLIYKLRSKDNLLLKKYLYKTLDKLTSSSTRNIEGYSTNIKVDEKFLNLENNIWYHPCTNKKNNTSVLDLYNDSIIELQELIILIDKYFDNKTKLPNIGNYSYLTGLDINKNKRLKYFKF